MQWVLFNLFLMLIITKYDFELREPYKILINYRIVIYDKWITKKQNSVTQPKSSYSLRWSEPLFHSIYVVISHSLASPYPPSLLSLCLLVFTCASTTPFRLSGPVGTSLWPFRSNQQIWIAAPNLGAFQHILSHQSVTLRATCFWPLWSQFDPLVPFNITIRTNFMSLNSYGMLIVAIVTISSYVKGSPHAGFLSGAFILCLFFPLLSILSLCLLPQTLCSPQWCVCVLLASLYLWG